VQPSLLSGLAFYPAEEPRHTTSRQLNPFQSLP
jgi:hypothetical protein